MIDRLILRYGLPTVLTAAVVAAALAIIGGKIAWKNIVIAWQANKIEKIEAQRDYAKAETKVAKADLEQTESAVEITDQARANTDAWLAFTAKQTANAGEVIHERIREVPVLVPVPSDPAVMRVVAEAHARATAAAHRLPGTQAR